MTSELTHGSLFSGIGGFDLGFENAGIKTLWQVEIDPYCRAVLAQHFPSATRHADVAKVGAHNLAPVDIISGGFPCQDISNAGLRGGIDGERSGLWSEYARIIRELRPRFVVVENVSALLVRGIERVLADLASCGYDAEWESIRAADVGAPHRRERIWIVAYPHRNGFEFERAPRLHADGAPGHDAARCGAHVADTTRGGRGVRWESSGQARLFARDGEDVADTNAKRRAGRANDEGQAPAERNGIAEGSVADTVRESGAAREEFHDERRALLSARPRECREGFPDTIESRLERAKRAELERSRIWRRDTDIAGSAWWAVEPNVGRVANGIPFRVDRLKGLGNAIIPQIAEEIARRILKSI